MPKFRITRFEVGGGPSLALSHHFKLKGIPVDFRYSPRKFYITAHCFASMGAKVTVPESSDDLTIEASKSFLVNHTYTFTGKKVNETIEQLSRAGGGKEIGEIMAWYDEYIAKNFSVA